MEDNRTTLDDIGVALNEIRGHDDLEKFRTNEGDKFCEKFHIRQGQLNFLLSVVSAERIKKTGLLQ